MSNTASAIQTREKSMIRKELTVRFNTPAFLGNAEQSGQWRTPPFKHLLREWWRVAWAEANDFNVNLDRMRHAEGRLFGVAADEGDTRQSQVRIRLGQWQAGRERRWKTDPGVFHPEVGANGRDVGAHLYLGYGPLIWQNQATSLKANAAIQAGEKNDLKLAYPDAEKSLLDRALALASAFGALGGRARNGWGSLELQGDTLPELEPLPLRDWRDCLRLEWAHAIGMDDDGALIWRTESFADWSDLMKALARLKIELRTQFGFILNGSAGDRQLYKFNKKKNKKEKSGIEHGAPQQRHWLSYPVTHHSVKPWDEAVKNTEAKRIGLGNRLPNSLRYKIRCDDDGRLYGVIFHMPCKPPNHFSPKTNSLEAVWRQVHRFLDGNNTIQRSPK